MTATTFFFCILFSIVYLTYNTPLPGYRRVCQTKTVKILDEKVSKLQLDFSSETFDVQEVVREVCDCWQSSRKIQRARRARPPNEDWLTKGYKVVIAFFGRKIDGLRDIFRKGVERSVSHAAKIVMDKRISYAESELTYEQIEENIMRSIRPLLKLFGISSLDTLKEKEVQISYDDFRLMIFDLLSNGSFESLSTVVSQKNDIGVNLNDDSTCRRIIPETMDCNSENRSISFNLAILYIKNELQVDYCDDIGYASKHTGQYHYYEFPEATFSNDSGTFEIDLQDCEGDVALDKIICISEVISPAECSVDNTENCELHSKSQQHEIYRELRDGVVVLGNFKNLVIWKNGLATPYEVQPYKLHYIRPRAHDKIRFGKHTITGKINNSNNIIKKIL